MFVRIALAAGAAVGLVLLQVYLQTSHESLFWASLMNAGHAPLFGCIAVLFLVIVRTLLGSRAVDSGLVSFGVFLLTAGLGVVTEIWQHFEARDAAPEDVARDLLGSAAFLLLVHARESRGLRRAARALLAVLLLGAALARITEVSAAYLARNLAFPRIAGFDARWESLFIEGRDAAVARVVPPAGWVGARRGKAARVTFLARHLPALVIREPRPDWRGRDHLSISLYSEERRPIEIVLRIHDLEHRSRHPDRYERVLRVQPGSNEVKIPLAEVRDTARGGPMDMAGIRYLVLYARDPREPFTLFIDEIRLE